MTVLGIDLRSSPQHESAVAILSESDKSLQSLTHFNTNEELSQIVVDQTPNQIAIGTPLTLPSGMCCLDKQCQCVSDNHTQKGRLCEIELAQMGISCFFTSKGSIITKLIYRAITIREILEGMGYPVVEVYPHASKVILFGDSVPPKNNPGSLTFIASRIEPMIAGVNSYSESLDIRAYDALLNAYTGILYRESATELLGSGDEGILAVPKLISSK